MATDAQMYIAALKDSALASLLPAMVAGREQALWVHTAGSMPMDVWKGRANHYGVFYPLQTFSKQREVDFREIPVFVEGCNDEVAAFLKEVAAALSGKVYEADSAQRERLHLAAVFACNFPNCLYRIAGELLGECGVPFEVLLPLMDETVDKVHRLPPALAQTGPAARGDEEVMRRHREMLAGHPGWQRLYELLSREIQSGKGEAGK